VFSLLSLAEGEAASARDMCLLARRFFRTWPVAQKTGYAYGSSRLSVDGALLQYESSFLFFFRQNKFRHFATSRVFD
jgi:hypothetical protein